MCKERRYRTGKIVFIYISHANSKSVIITNFIRNICYCDIKWKIILLNIRKTLQIL